MSMSLKSRVRKMEKRLKSGNRFRLRMRDGTALIVPVEVALRKVFQEPSEVADVQQVGDGDNGILPELMEAVICHGKEIH